MDTRDQIKAEIESLIQEGSDFSTRFLNGDEEQNFPSDYQRWYTRALRLVELVASDRYDEFRQYYEIDPKRKSLGYGTYVIQDYLKGVAPNRGRYPGFDTKQEVAKNLINQLSIVSALYSRIDSVLDDIQGELLSSIQDSELETANQLLKISVRAAGSVAGVVLENHLQKVLTTHKISLRKKHPTINDLTDPLKKEQVIDTPTWRRIAYLADIRNLCSHKKETNPTKDQVRELIDGTNWVIKNVF